MISCIPVTQSLYQSFHRTVLCCEWINSFKIRRMLGVRCAFLFCSASIPQRSTHFSSFYSESLTQSWRHRGSVPRENIHSNTDKSSLAGPLNKQAKEIQVQELTALHQLSPTTLTGKITASHLWIICTKFINWTELDQLFIDAETNKQRTEFTCSSFILL